METEIDNAQYASSPCLAHEPDVSALPPGEPDGDVDMQDFYIVYLYVEEGGAGYRWQVRGHEVHEPLASSPELFPSAVSACEAGRAALDRVCDRFDYHPRFK